LAVLVVLPLSLVGQQLVGELTAGVTAVQQQLASGDLQRLVESHPLLARAATLIERHVDLASIVGDAAPWLTGLGGSILRGSLSHLVTVLTFYPLFYFLRDRREACAS
jgi:predicted PurR-regulated permease PerM